MWIDIGRVAICTLVFIILLWMVVLSGGLWGTSPRARVAGIATLVFLVGAFVGLSTGDRLAQLDAEREAALRRAAADKLPRPDRCPNNWVMTQRDFRPWEPPTCVPLDRKTKRTES